MLEKLRRPPDVLMVALVCHRFPMDVPILARMAIEQRVLKKADAVGRPVKRWDVRWRAPGEQAAVRTRSFATLEEAKFFEASTKRTQLRGGSVDPKTARQPFREVAADWLESNPNKRPRSIQRDLDILEAHVLPAFGNRQVGSIVRRDVQSFVTVLAKSTYKPNTVRRIYATLSAVMNWAASQELIEKSPCIKNSINLPSPTKLPRIPTTAEQRLALIEHAGADGIVIRTALLLGLRWGEVVALRVGAVDFLNGEISVHDAVVEAPGGLVYGPPKSKAGTRVLHAPRSLLEPLANHMKERGLTSDDRNELLFVGPEGGAWRASNFRSRVFEPARIKAGIPVGITFHSLRKMQATGMVRSGVDIRTAATRLGHSDTRLLLEVYAEGTTEAERNAADAAAAWALPPETKLQERKMEVRSVGDFGRSHRTSIPRKYR